MVEIWNSRPFSFILQKLNKLKQEIWRQQWVCKCQVPNATLALAQESINIADLYWCCPIKSFNLHLREDKRSQSFFMFISGEIDIWGLMCREVRTREKNQVWPLPHSVNRHGTFTSVISYNCCSLNPTSPSHLYRLLFSTSEITRVFLYLKVTHQKLLPQKISKGTGEVLNENLVLISNLASSVWFL